jgi:hypothetical protein
MSWTRVSLLTKVTRDPAEIVTVRGDTPLAVIVIVEVPGVGDGVGEGEGEGDGVGDADAGVALLPPHPMPIITTAATQNDAAAKFIRFHAGDRSIIRRTSLKC